MKKVFNLVIVDESGSMGAIRREALTGINETLKNIKAIQKQFPDMEQVVTLLTFDSEHQTFIYDNAKVRTTRQLRPDEYQPGGGTPLYDAIGKGIAKVKGHVMADDSVLVTIITDGYENCSEEYTLATVKKLIEELKKEEWTFTFIGTDNLDVEGAARELGIEDHLSFAQDSVGTQEMFAKERSARVNFNRRRFNNELEVGGQFWK